MAVPGVVGNSATCQGGSAAPLTFAQLEGYWIAAGGSKTVAPIMAAVALAESSGVATTVNCWDSNWQAGNPSVGLWQLVQSHAPGVDLTDPLANATAAVQLYNQQGFGPWTTYASGAYKQYMPSGSVTPVIPSETSTMTTPNASTDVSLLPAIIGSGLGGLGVASGLLGGGGVLGALGLPTWSEFKSVMARAALIAFGAIALLVGISKLVGGSGAPAPTGGGGGGAEGKSPAAEAEAAAPEAAVAA